MILPRLFTVRREGPGRLSTMAAPRGGEWLAEELQALRLVGVDTVVSLLTRPELSELGLLDEPQAAEDAGLRFLELPTPDRQTPELAATRLLAADLADQLAAGCWVAIHCRAGIGRASVLAATVLRLDGVTTEDAWRRISDARGLSVPDTEEQRRFVDQVQWRPSRPR